MNSWSLFLLYSLVLIGVMLLAEISYRVFKLNTEATRKIAHVGSGITALTYPVFINNYWVVLGLTISFTFILFACKKIGLFPSIFSVGRKSYGELLFVWSSFFLFWWYQHTGEQIHFYLPFSILVFADPVAAIVGKYLPIKIYRIFNHIKSLGGSVAFFITTFLLSYYFLSGISLENIYLISLLHTVFLTITEGVSVKGWDNLTIPSASLIFLHLIL